MTRFSSTSGKGRNRVRNFLAFLFVSVLSGVGAALYAMGGAGAVAAKPQTPRPPYPYTVEEVTVETPDGEARLTGTLTLPAEQGPHPAVVLLSVAGPTDRDQSFAGHAGYNVLADHLTRRGFAVARFDDRGAGASTGEYFEASWDALADDALAIVQTLANDRRTDPRRIGIAGMSQGAAVAAMAATRGEAVAFLILMSAPGLPGEEALFLQLDKTLAVSGIEGAEAERYRELFRDYMEIVKGDPAAPETRSRLLAFLNGPGRALIPPYGFLPQDDEDLADVLLGPWYRSNLLFDPQKTYGGVAVPALIVAGGKDFVAPSDRHAPAIEQLLNGAPTDDVTLVVLPSLNHLLQDAETGLPTEYASLETSFSPDALNAISAWLGARFAGPRK